MKLFVVVFHYIANDGSRWEHCTQGAVEDRTMGQVIDSCQLPSDCHRVVRVEYKEWVD